MSIRMSTRCSMRCTRCRHEYVYAELALEFCGASQPATSLHVSWGLSSTWEMPVGDLALLHGCAAAVCVSCPWAVASDRSDPLAKGTPSRLTQESPGSW